MDYEKKYNEALARAKDVKNGPSHHDSSVATVEYIFPELRESEDERIRQGLLKIFKQSQNGYWAGMEIKDIVAYLEKKKEQKPQEPQVFCEAKAFDLGYKQAEKDILSFVESRIYEIIGDAQPKPALRAELEELIKRIKDGNNAGRANTTM